MICLQQQTIIALWHRPYLLHKAVTGETVPSTWGFIFLQHYVMILLKPCETFSVFGAFFTFMFTALDDEQALKVTGNCNKAAEKSGVLLPPSLPEFTRTWKCRSPGMTIEIKMDIIEADEVSRTNISWPSFGERLAWVTSNRITLHDTKMMRYLIAKKWTGLLSKLRWKLNECTSLKG